MQRVPSSRPPRSTAPQVGRQHAAAFWLLTAYKALAALVVLAAGLYVLLHAGDLRASLTALAANWTGRGGLAAWSGGVMGGAVSGLPERGFTATGVLLLVDGLLLALTAVALARRSPAARGLVLAAIIVPLLPEVYLLTRHVRLGEVLALLVNLGILAYVWRYYPRHH